MKLIVNTLLTAGLLLAAVVLGGCSDNDSSTNPAGVTGTLSVKITDAPAAYDQVLVTFSEVAVHMSGTEDDEGLAGDDAVAKGAQDGDASGSGDDGWIVISDAVQTFDLLTLANGVTALLGGADIEAGHYTQIRLVIDSASVTVDGETYDLTVPSSTVKFVRSFDVADGGSTELIVDFDASRSVHRTGGNNAKYMLKPTIRITESIITGSITGVVTNPADAPTAYAISGADTVSSSFVDTVTGEFTLSYLDEATYEVAIVDTLVQSFSNPAVTVAAGQANDIGSVTLE